MYLMNDTWITDEPITPITKRMKLYILLEAAGFRVRIGAIEVAMSEEAIYNRELYKGHLGHTSGTNNLFAAYYTSRNNMMFEGGVPIQYAISEKELVEQLVKMIKENGPTS